MTACNRDCSPQTITIMIACAILCSAGTCERNKTSQEKRHHPAGITEKVLCGWMFFFCNKDYNIKVLISFTQCFLYDGVPWAAVQIRCICSLLIWPLLDALLRCGGCRWRWQVDIYSKKTGSSKCVCGEAYLVCSCICGGRLVAQSTLVYLTCMRAF